MRRSKSLIAFLEHCGLASLLGEKGSEECAAKPSLDGVELFFFFSSVT